jgi:transcriptional regulator with XRE-family HTH domain/tetratricopeptide (TPR) repeat protein
MTPVTSLPFGVALKRARRGARLTQAQLAERAGFSVVYISMLERGTRQPQRTTVDLLADALALTADERAALEVAAQLPTPSGEPAPSERDATPLAVPLGGFLGATPTGPLVGRAVELRHLHTALDAVASGQGRLLLLAGEAGVGKTRLAQEIMLRARAQGFAVLTGRCYEPQQAVAYYPFLQALAMAEAGADPTVLARLPEQWPEVNHLLPDHMASTPTPLPLDDRNAQQRLFWQVGGFLQALAERAPLALLLDDLHWADTASLDLLAHLARQARERRLLLVGTYREAEVGRQHPLEGMLRDLTRDELVERLVVHPLAADETTALIGATLGADGGVEVSAITVPEEVAQRIYARSEGNAFFTRQLVRALQEQGDLEFAEGQWRLSANLTPALEAPESIRSVIIQRLGRLTPLTQEVLREASVLGQVFHFEDLRGLAGRGEQEVEEALEEAVVARIVREGQQESYHFNHALTRDTLSADLAARRRRRLHRAAADALERLPDHERWAAELAYHLLAAEERARALPYALLAGDQAEAVYAHAEAEGHYRLALRVTEELGEQGSAAQVLEKLGLAVRAQGRLQDALERLDQSAALYQANGDQEGEYRTVAALAHTYANLGMYDEGLARLRPLVAVADALDVHQASSGVAALYLAVAYLTWRSRDATEAQQFLAAATRTELLARAADDERILASAQLWRVNWKAVNTSNDVTHELLDLISLAERIGDPRLLTEVLVNLESRLLYQGNPGAGRVHLARVLEIAEQTQDPTMLAGALLEEAEFAYYAGEWPHMLEVVTRAGVIMHELNLHNGGIDVARMQGILALAQGDETQGRAWLALAGSPTEHPLSGTMVAHYLAEADLLSGQADVAATRLAPALPLISVQQQGMLTHWALSMEAWAELERGHVDQALATSRECVAQTRADSYQLFLVDDLRIQALVAMRLGMWDVAQESLDEALTLSQEIPHPYAEAKALWAYGRLEAARGDAAGARDRFAQALLICDRLGEGLYRARIERDLWSLTQTT